MLTSALLLVSGVPHHVASAKRHRRLWKLGQTGTYAFPAAGKMQFTPPGVIRLALVIGRAVVLAHAWIVEV